jgi:hypothetical protein
MRFLLSAVVLAGAATAALGSVEANSNATVQPGGPRTGGNGVAFFNIEGSNNTTFASYGVARFDLTAEWASLDATYGAGNWTVTGAALALVESNAAFSAPGAINVYFSSDDATSILAGASPLAYDVGSLPGGNSQGVNGLLREGTPVASYVFPTTGNINSGQVDSYALTLTPGLLSNLTPGGDAAVTLVFEGQDPGVAATYAGSTNATYDGPTLTIIAQAVPAPSSVLLLGIAGLSAARRRRA